MIRTRRIDPGHLEGSPVSVLDLLAKFGGGLAGLTVIALVMGRSELQGYFLNLGAPWIMPLMSPARLISASYYPFYYLCGGGLIFGFYLYGNLKGGVVDLLPVGLMFLVTVLASFLPFNTRSIDWDRVYLQGLGSSLIMGSGFLLCMVCRRVLFQKLKLDPLHFGVSCFAVLCIASMGPNLLGRSRGMTELKSPYARPEVEFQDGLLLNRRWLLVTPLESGFLIMAIDASSEKPIFRVVSPSEMGGVRSFRAKTSNVE